MGLKNKKCIWHLYIALILKSMIQSGNECVQIHVNLCLVLLRSRPWSGTTHHHPTWLFSVSQPQRLYPLNLNQLSCQGGSFFRVAREWGWLHMNSFPSLRKLVGVHVLTDNAEVSSISFVIKGRVIEGNLLPLNIPFSPWKQHLLKTCIII